jgi:DNA-binding Xre family transcriptional regulator
MGNDSSIACRAAWQLFNKVDDPLLSTVEKLAEALGCQPKDLL